VKLFATDRFERQVASVELKIDIVVVVQARLDHSISSYPNPSALQVAPQVRVMTKFGGCHFNHQGGSESFTDLELLGDSVSITQRIVAGLFFYLLSE
jgi:hypothetical protein